MTRDSRVFTAGNTPFIMWASPAYIAAHPDRFQKMEQAQSLPLQQDFISHTLPSIRFMWYCGANIVNIG